MFEKLKEFATSKHRGIVGNIIMLVIGLILVVSVLMPTTISVISAQNASVFAISTTASQILALTPLFIALLALIMIAGYLMVGRK